MKTIRKFENQNGKVEMISNDDNTRYDVYLNDRVQYDLACFGEAMKHFVNIMYNLQNNLSNYAKY